MSALPFLDTNILLRHLTQDHAAFSPRATAYVRRIERGEIMVRTADTVVFETVFLLERGYRQPKLVIRDTVLPLLELAGIILPGKEYLRKVFALYVEANIPFADAYHAVLMEQFGLHEIVSFDRDFDRIPGIMRVEP
jgi:predicted nucleic acid-binding protein